MAEWSPFPLSVKMVRCSNIGPKAACTDLGFSSFPQSLQANAAYYHFPIRYSLFIPPFGNTVQPELLTLLLNKPYITKQINIFNIPGKSDIKIEGTILIPLPGTQDKLIIHYADNLNMSKILKASFLS